jgi:hypothetical protein
MPVPKAPRHKRKAPHRTYVLDQYLEGDLAGGHVVMGAMTAREMIRLRSGEVSEGEAIEFTASKVIEHDFDVPDIRDIDGEDLLAISVAWAAAMKDAAVPPTPATS